MNRKTGFTLIELLVVIAIIAILAAIIFPVYMRTRQAAYRSGDMSNMNAIRNALQLYRADQEAYPPQILGYASFYDPGMTQVVPASSLHAALFPKRINSVRTMQPGYDRYDVKDLTVAHWPNADPRPLGTAPIGDLNGDGLVDANDDSGLTADARQLYGPNVYFCTNSGTCNNFATGNASDGALLYKVSGFDAAEVRDVANPGATKWELRYTLRWSSFALGGGSRYDDPRQLIYSDPPDNTVVTWDSWFREYDANNLPRHDKMDFVLFLGGGARPFDSNDLYNRSWRVTP